MEEVFIDIARNRRAPSREEDGAAVDELLTTTPAGAHKEPHS